MERGMETLIFQNLEEIIDRENIVRKIGAKKQLTCYIGFAPTGKIHIGYLIPCMKIRDLTVAGCKVAIMIADIHAILDARKTPPHLVKLRSTYYQIILMKILEILGAKVDNIKFVQGSDFQKSGEYIMDLLELSSRVTLVAAKKAGTEVIKQGGEGKLGSAIYPVMQAIDENYVGQAAFGVQIDMELGGIDQRKIFCFSRDLANENGKISYLMNPMLSLSNKGKMSCSDNMEKISIHDTDDNIEGKIEKAYCADGEANCGIMKMVEYVFFPMERKIIITMDNKIKCRYNTYEEFEKDFKNKIFTGRNLKESITHLICDFVSKMREYLYEDTMQLLLDQAYPN